MRRRRYVKRHTIATPDMAEVALLQMRLVAELREKKRTLEESYRSAQRDENGSPQSLYRKQEDMERDIQELEASMEKRVEAKFQETMESFFYRMGREKWRLANRISITYPDQMRLSFFIFVENGIPCEYKRILSSQLFEGTENLNVQLTEETQAQLQKKLHPAEMMRVHISARTRLVLAAIDKMVSAQEDEGWSFISTLPDSYIFIRDLPIDQW